MRLRARIKKALPYLALIAVVLAFVNFFWFIAESAALGGDALSGYARGGHYYVASHGAVTEVSERTWAWSQIHGVSLFITHGLGMAAMAYLLSGFIFPTMMLAMTSEVVTGERAKRVRSSGPLLASDRTAGQIGDVRFSGPLLEVSVYPGGVVIKPSLMKERAIFASEIRGVVAKRSIFGWRVEVAHAGLDSRSPFVLFRSGDSPLVRAIWQAMPVAPPGLRAAVHPFADADVPATRDTKRDHTDFMVTFGIIAVGVSVMMVAFGVLWAIPNLGFIGIIWTTLAVLITVSNARRFLTKP
jgi:hypothetical protein